MTGEPASRSRRPAAKDLLLLFAALAAVVFVWPVRALVVEEAKSQTVLWCRLLEPGDVFVLTYLHSVELCRVWDHFQIDGEYRLVLDKTVFPSSNTGLPAVLGDGERLALGEDGFRISNMRRVFHAIEIWVDRRYDNAMIIAGQEIKLPELAGNTLLRIKAKQIIFAEYLYVEGRPFLLSRFLRKSDERQTIKR